MPRKERPPTSNQDRRAREGERAMPEQRAHTEAVDKNTERLRALRLERDAAAQQKDGEGNT